ncbi:protein tesmin/TSO1-like CXC 2 isoform X2 [Nymphaea colorata]|uniref:protein tesmin/TSO1-like CXC 2 isoform X2 n=1 Tax=Nymphaea colorata TaxID=210225 RepID=UPI00129D9F7C|nr:protein tesmin/TSO1-like CXC 2 isoform X2 [Nymphaea colorata]
MGTPEKKQMIEDCVDASAAAEGSPVFNYISSLSPIKPVKSIHVSHTFQELNCASPPYAFAFPRISTGQSSNLRRDRLSASSDAKFSPNTEECKASKGADVLEHPSCSIKAAVKLESDGVHSAASQENCNQSLVLCSSDGGPIYDDCSTDETIIPSIRESNLIVEAYQILHYIDNVSKDIMAPPNNVKMASGNDMASIMPSTEIKTPGISSSFLQFVNISNAYESQSVQNASEIQIHTANVKDSVGLLNQENGEGPGCNWGDVVNDIDEFFLFSPSAEAEVHSGQAHVPSNLNRSYGSSFAPKHSQTVTTGWNKIKICGSLQSSHNVNGKDSINGFNEPDELDAMDLTPQMSSTVLQSVISNGDRIEKTDDRSIYPDGHWNPLGCKVEQQQVRGVKRRCLVFEAVGHKKNMEGNAELVDSKPSHSDRNIFPDDKQLIPSDATYSRRMPSGIGLHLNSLANPSIVGRVIKQEAMISGSQVMNTTASLAVNPEFVAQEPTESSVDMKLTDCDLDISKEKISPVAVVPAFEFGEEIIQQSPKKKRRKASHSGEKEGCKKCHCKRSKCLKLYCECFAAGVYCIQQCSCQGCLNKPEHEDTVLETRERIESRNPLAFVPKVVKPAEPVVENKEEENKLSISARHKTGCNCKKSKCLKKYCECFQGGVGCSNGCRCEGCMNTFGKKEAPKLLTGSREVEEEVSEVAEPDENPKSQEIEKDDDKQSSQESSLTAFEICRSAILPPPFLSSGKAPQSSRISGCNTVNSGFLLSRLKSEKHFMRTILEDDTPEFLRARQSPNDKVTVASPNRKRISPPRIESGACPGFRNSRKLVLHPISSLQPLRVAHCSDDLSTKLS